MTFEEAAVLMIRGGKSKEIGITKNGDYTITDEEKAEGYVGYNPLHVNVAPNLTTITITENGEYGPPSGYDGYSKVTANVPTTSIQVEPIEITANGKYFTAENLAWNPITVNVPQYTPVIGELSVTANGTYYANGYGYDAFDPVNVNVPDRYDEGYKDGQENGKYTFPDGTPYEDIINLIGGDDNVSDETLGVQIKTEYSEDEHTYNVSVRIYDLSGNYIANLGGISSAWSFIEAWGKPKVIRIVITDSTTGAYEITYMWTGDGYTFTQTGTDTHLIGFGENDHTYSVSNNR